MDTKSKKSRPLLVWICFFLSLNLLFLLGMAGVYTVGNLSYGDLNSLARNMGAIVRSDIRELDEFNTYINDKLYVLAEAVSGPKADAGPDGDDLYPSSLQGRLKMLFDEGENVYFHASNMETGRSLYNREASLELNEDAMPVLPEGYDMVFYFNGKGFTVEKDGKLQYDTAVANTTNNLFSQLGTEAAGRLRICLAVKKEPLPNPTAYSRLYAMNQQLDRFRAGFLVLCGLILFTLALLVISFVKRGDKRAFDRRLASISGRVWFEFKVLLSMAVFFFAGTLVMEGREILPVFGLFILFWWFYLMAADLLINRRRFFANNSISAAIRVYRRFEARRPLHKGLLMRFLTFVAVETVLIGIASLLFAVFAMGDGYPALLLLLIAVVAGVYLLYRYYRRYSHFLGDLAKLSDHLELVRNGGLNERLALNPGSDLYPAAENLNLIREGIQEAVEERMKSERLKVELVTNVSHDLKTPLTSIISYTDLLSRTEGLPEQAGEYVAILSRKSERLKILIQDLFELSKASSGSAGIVLERLDLAKLIRQTLADMDEQIAASGLVFKTSLPDEPVYVKGDGNKLYRVFLNLFGNALKYSLTGSRVYIGLFGEENRVRVEVKNVANYEMDFMEGDMLERFTRGDKSRTTEGSGLGLAIARSFTQLCGGELKVKVDGDLFKVMLTFPRLSALNESAGSAPSGAGKAEPGPFGRPSEPSGAFEASRTAGASHTMEANDIRMPGESGYSSVIPLTVESEDPADIRESDEMESPTEARQIVEPAGKDDSEEPSKTVE